MCNSTELQHLSNLICQTRSICLVASRSPQVNGRTKLKFWCNCTSHISLQKENSSPSHQFSIWFYFIVDRILSEPEELECS